MLRRTNFPCVGIWQLVSGSIAFNPWCVWLASRVCVAAQGVGRGFLLFEEVTDDVTAVNQQHSTFSSAFFFPLFRVKLEQVKGFFLFTEKFSAAPTDPSNRVTGCFRCQKGKMKGLCNIISKKCNWIPKVTSTLQSHMQVFGSWEEPGELRREPWQTNRRFQTKESDRQPSCCDVTALTPVRCYARLNYYFLNINTFQ